MALTGGPYAAPDAGHVRPDQDGSEQSMIDRESMFESVLPDLSGMPLAELGEDTNPHLERILARLRREAQTRGVSQAGFNSSVCPDRAR